MRQQMGAAFVGLLAGLAIVVPTVLWLSGVFDSGKVKVTGSAPDVVAARRHGYARCQGCGRRLRESHGQSAGPPGREVRARTPVRGAICDRQRRCKAARAGVRSRASAGYSPAPVPAAHSAAVASVATATTAARLVEPSTRLEELLAQARQRVESGDVGGARELLSNAEEGSQGAAVFALAETYDPNMLAAWGTRGVAADVAKARALYRKALNLGAAHAQVRLDALR